MTLLFFFLSHDHMGLEISKRCSYSFHPISAKDIAYHKVFMAHYTIKFLWHILTMESMGQS